MPFYADIEQIQTDPASIKPGFTILSQNTLSTVITSVGYEYSDGRNNFHYQLTWQGWLPIFESRIDYGSAPVVYKLGSNVGEPVQLSPAVNFANSISIPLTFSTGRFTQFFYSSLTATYQNNYVYLKEARNMIMDRRSSCREFIYQTLTCPHSEIFIPGGVR